MTETEKQVRDLEVFKRCWGIPIEPIDAAIKALRACEKIRALIEREGREASAAEIEGLLP